MIDIQVEMPGRFTPVETRQQPLDAAAWPDLVQRAVRATLADQGVEVAELSVTLLDDAPIRKLNHEYLGHDRPTDVIAFALHGEGEPVLGDVYVGWRQAILQAEREGVPPREEIARLAIHGTLHVLGFDHPDEAEGRSRSEMFRVQEVIVAALDLAPRASAGSSSPAPTASGDSA